LVPDQLIKRWNTWINTLEVALLSAIDAYLDLQDELRKDIITLAKLTTELMDMALLHDPTAIINYIDGVIRNARSQGAAPEQLTQLTTAKNTLLLALQVKERGVEGTTRDFQILHQVLSSVKTEMGRRKELKPVQRAQEEEKPCHLYNKILQTLPLEIKRKAPGPLKRPGWFQSGLGLFRGAPYSENLRAVVKLVKVVLGDVSVQGFSISL
jgi:hypothetical protein